MNRDEEMRIRRIARRHFFGDVSYKTKIVFVPDVKAAIVPVWSSGNVQVRFVDDGDLGINEIADAEFETAVITPLYAVSPDYKMGYSFKADTLAVYRRAGYLGGEIVEMTISRIPSYQEMSVVENYLKRRYHWTQRLWRWAKGLFNRIRRAVNSRRRE